MGMWRWNLFWSSDLGIGALVLAVALSVAALPGVALAAPEVPAGTGADEQAQAAPVSPDAGALCAPPGSPCGDLSLPERSRNPFASVKPGAGRVAAQDDAVLNVRFDGSDLPYGLPTSLKNLPRLRVVGLLDNGSSISVLADLDTRGRVILRPSEQVFLSDDKRGNSDALWFTVKEITHNTMTLILKDGVVVHGNFF